MSDEPCLPHTAFNVAGPAELSQGSWLHDEGFVAALVDSWTAQYADYIGLDKAMELVERLRLERNDDEPGELFSHYPPGTVLAKVDGQLVGIAALRALDGVSLVTMLEVVDSHRGLGIGKQLIMALAQQDQPLLAHVSVHRAEVARFYEGMGFKALERTRVDHYGYALEFDVMVRRG